MTLSAGGPLSISTTCGLILFAMGNIGQSIRTKSAELISSRCSCNFFTTLLAWNPLRLLRSIRMMIECDLQLIFPVNKSRTEWPLDTNPFASCIWVVEHKSDSNTSGRKPNNIHERPSFKVIISYQ